MGSSHTTIYSSGLPCLARRQSATLCYCMLFSLRILPYHSTSAPRAAYATLLTGSAYPYGSLAACTRIIDIPGLLAYTRDCRSEPGPQLSISALCRRRKTRIPCIHVCGLARAATRRMRRNPKMPVPMCMICEPAVRRAPYPCEARTRGPLRTSRSGVCTRASVLLRRAEFLLRWPSHLESQVCTSGSSSSWAPCG